MLKSKSARTAFIALGASFSVVGAAYSDENNAPPTTTLNSEISRAIQEVTGRAALPGEADPARYGFSYTEIKSRVARVYLPCNDAQVSQAIFEATGRPARGLENQGECNIALYNGGRWENYADLKSKVQQTLVTSPYETGVCRLPEVTKAITEYKTARGIANVKPSGMGELGECNSALYGGGVWTSFDDLKSKVAWRLNAIQSAGLRLLPDNSVTPIASRGNSGKWLSVAGAVFTALGQWKADDASKKQAAPQQMVPQMPPQPMPGTSPQGMESPVQGLPPQGMPATGMPPVGMPAPNYGYGSTPAYGNVPAYNPPAPMGGLQPNMITPEMMQQLLLMLQAQQQQGAMQPGMIPQPQPYPYQVAPPTAIPTAPIAPPSVPLPAMPQPR